MLVKTPSFNNLKCLLHIGVCRRGHGKNAKALLLLPILSRADSVVMRWTIVQEYISIWCVNYLKIWLYTAWDKQELSKSLSPEMHNDIMMQELLLISNKWYIAQNKLNLMQSTK